MSEGQQHNRRENQALLNLKEMRLQKTLLAQANLAEQCDVFVLNEGAQRYRDALPLAVLAQNLVPRNVRICPVLARTERRDAQHEDLAVEQRARLTAPTTPERSAIVLGRAELFGPEMEFVLFRQLKPPLPAAMDDVPSDDGAFRELRLLLGRIKKLKIDAKERGRQPFHDYAIVYCGWQQTRVCRRRIILLEGLSALGTVGAAKAFCETTIPEYLNGVENCFVVYHTTLDFRERGPKERAFLNDHKKGRAAAILPWTWDDVVVGDIKYVQAVAPMKKVGADEFLFLQRLLEKHEEAQMEMLRLAVLDRLITQPGAWIDENDLFQTIAIAQAGEVPGGWHQALRQVLVRLIAQGLVIEWKYDRFRHIA